MRKVLRARIFMSASAQRWRDLRSSEAEVAPGNALTLVLAHTVEVHVSDLNLTGYFTGLHLGLH